MVASIRLLLALGLAAWFGSPASRVPVAAADDQLVAALLPLPASLRDGAGVRGYTASLTLVTLRESSNGIVCTADRPGDDVFDVRCYDHLLLHAIDRRRELGNFTTDSATLEKKFAEEVSSGGIRFPKPPTTSFRMYGPIQAYDSLSHRAGAGIKRWQSLHFPYRTAAQLGFPTVEEPSMPFVLGSGTWWSQIVIMHDAPCATGGKAPK